MFDYGGFMQLVTSLFLFLMLSSCGLNPGLSGPKEPNFSSSSISSFNSTYQTGIEVGDDLANQRSLRPGDPLPRLTENSNYPLKPDQKMTPGSVCESERTKRYPERISYCERDVASETKQAIFKAYDDHLNYNTRRLPREDFKIDHLIPLCMGGSNQPSNLWPQYVHVYLHTDPLEPTLCSLMAEGKLAQARAIELIKAAKQDPEAADAYLEKAVNGR
jgi:hypothetical protein